MLILNQYIKLPIIDNKMEESNNTLTFKIYYSLKKKPHSITSLMEVCTLAGFKISARSLYRHILKIENSLDISIEILETEVLNHNKKLFFIRSVESNDLLARNNSSQWILLITQLFLNAKTSHQIFNQNNEFENFIDKIKQKSPLKVKEIISLETFNKQIINSRFGQANFCDKQQQILIDLMWCMNKRVYFKINEFELSTTKKYNEQPQLNELLIPLKVIYHRKDFILKCYSVKSKKIFTLEFDKITKICIQKESCQLLKIVLESDGHDFGFHPPICKTIYHIKLLFPPTPGGFIMNRFWHESQKFKIKKDGYILMTLDVRVCIELLGWIMQWMDNVQVLSPVFIKKIIGERLDNMKQINENTIVPINNSNSLIL